MKPRSSLKGSLLPFKIGDLYLFLYQVGGSLFRSRSSRCVQYWMETVSPVCVSHPLTFRSQPIKVTTGPSVSPNYLRVNPLAVFKTRDERHVYPRKIHDSPNHSWLNPRLGYPTFRIHLVWEPSEMDKGWVPKNHHQPNIIPPLRVFLDYWINVYSR